MSYEYHPPRSDEAAWAAGIFEGEGSISISATRGSVTLKVAMTDEDVIRRLRSILDCGATYGPYRRAKRPDDKDSFEWKVNRQSDVVHVLSLLLPYLGRRRKKRALQAMAIVTPRLVARTA